MLNKILAIIIILFPLWVGAWTETYTFEDGTNEAACTGSTGFDSAGTTTTFSTTMAHTGTKSAKFIHPVGQDDWNEATGIIGIPNVAEGGEIWIRWYDYIVPTWDWTANPVVKVMRIGTYNTGGEGEGWLSVFAHHTDGMIMLSNEPLDIQTNSTTAFTQGAWTCYEMYVKLHATAGQAIFRIWKNGILVHNDITHATFVNATDTARIVYVWSYWNGNVPATQTDYLDDLIITSDTPANRDAADNPMIGPSDWESEADETAPTIINITSSKADGTYTVGEVITVNVTADESVTSTGNVTVTCETGDTDRTCTFTMTATNSGQCSYTVQAGDTSADLNCTVSGTITDLSLNAMTDFVPEAANVMSALKAIVIDTTAPAVSAFTVPETVNGTRLVTSSTFTCTGTPTGYMMWESADAPLASNAAWTATAPTSYTFSSDGTKTLYAFCRDLAGNVSATGVSDTVIVTTIGVTSKLPWRIP
jgi:hypothetical protein